MSPRWGAYRLYSSLVDFMSKTEMLQRLIHFKKYVKWFHSKAIESTESQFCGLTRLQGKPVWGQIGLCRIVRNYFLPAALSLSIYQSRAVSVIEKCTRGDLRFLQPKGYHSTMLGEGGYKLSCQYLIIFSGLKLILIKQWRTSLDIQEISIIIIFKSI